MDLLYLNLLLSQVVCDLGEIRPFSKGSSDSRGSKQLPSKGHAERLLGQKGGGHQGAADGGPPGRGLQKAARWQRLSYKMEKRAF